MSNESNTEIGAGLTGHQASPNIRELSESSFFTQQRAESLPSPAKIRILNEQSGHRRATYFNRPSPVIIPSLGIFVKYGADVTVLEAKTQIKVRELLLGQVPIPEVFGWAEDGQQVFIYMDLIEGDTLMSRWGELDEIERQSICAELRQMVNTWRAFKQDEGESFIGRIGKNALNEILVDSRPEFQGPYLGADAVKQFHDACGIDISSDVPIVFTHNDLVPPNILLSQGPNPKVASIIDWAQSGWYPDYWEYCKGRQVGVLPEHFSVALLEEWRAKYLPLIIDPVDEEEIFHPFLYFVLSKI